MLLSLHADDLDFIEDEATLDHRINPFLNYQLGVWGNTSGGITQAVRFNSLAQFGASANTEKLGWWPGGQFLASWLFNEGNLNNNPLTGLNGAFALDRNLASNTIRFYDIYYQQSFNQKRYTFKIGQLAADDNFMLSNYAGLFVNSAFGDIPTIGNLSGYPQYPLAAPGVFFSAQFIDEFTLKTGLYTNDAGPDQRTNWGFDWNFGGDAGFAWFTEAEYSPKIMDLPASLTAGLFLQIDGQATEQSTGNTFNGQTIYSLYFMWDQALLLNNKGDTELAAFWRVGYTPDDERFTVNQFYTDVGLNWFGPIPGRDKDILGMAFNYGTYTDGYRQANPTTKADQWVIELTYSVAITDEISFQPDIQCVLNPELASRNYALAVGCMFIVSL